MAMNDFDVWDQELGRLTADSQLGRYVELALHVHDYGHDHESVHASDHGYANVMPGWNQAH